nr:MAG TPA: hypothetical protein [Bacteriophage sp.]
MMYKIPKLVLILLRRLTKALLEILTRLSLAI